ncbi:MAG: efflux RND transporter periplasmic adaptor subunit [Rhodocyclaceae bacterium]|nr:efflux RND transporter periplasmic adaptor subunit [Rhodocyclaceae bacterium]MCA3081612.1 efflux RND transporter periplasmic adaptor subunit [Rhodocyclaceae bacterium]
MSHLLADVSPTTRFRRRYAGLMAASVAVAAVVAGCGKGPPQGGFSGMPPAAVTYDVIAVRDIPVTREFVGQANGSREVEIRARVNGIVEKRLYEEGATVKAGQPLFRLDSAPYAAAAGQAEAAVATAEANLKQAEREYARLKPLLDAKAISQKEWDTAASAVDVSRAQLKQAQAQLQSARVDLGYTDIRAPISGVIGRALRVEGALASVASDSLLATMAQTDPIHVNFAIAEQDRNTTQAEVASGALKLPQGGYAVKLKTSDGQVIKASGKIDFNDYKADANTGAYAARATIANTDGVLTPGQFVRVVLSGGIRPNAIAVPQRAVLDGPMGKFVYVVGKGQDGKPAAEPRPVVPGEWVTLEGPNNNGWIIKQGLKVGDQVVIDGMARIFAPGQALMPMTVEEATKAAAAGPTGGAPGQPAKPGEKQPADKTADKPSAPADAKK